VHVAAFQAQPEEGEEWLKKVHREGLSLMQGLMADPEQCPSLWLDLPRDPDRAKSFAGSDQVRFICMELAMGRHKGELVDLHTEWRPVRRTMPRPWAHPGLYHRQFDLVGPRDEPAPGGDWSYGKDDHMAGRWRPDRGKQVNRWLAPDVDSWEWHWRRSAKVTSLAHLFRHLGDRFTARALYDFYLSLRLVSAKKFRKGGICPARRGLLPRMRGDPRAVRRSGPANPALAG